MRKIIFSALLGFSLAIPLAAQTARRLRPKTSPPGCAIPTSRIGNFIARTAEKMPEEFYGIRPGAQPEVRTFGQVIGHLANFNYRWCSDAKGEKNPMEETDFEKLTAKADLVKALDSALDLLRRRVCHAHGCQFHGPGARHDGTTARKLPCCESAGSFQISRTTTSTTATSSRTCGSRASSRLPPSRADSRAQPLTGAPETCYVAPQCSTHIFCRWEETSMGNRASGNFETSADFSDANGKPFDSGASRRKFLKALAVAGAGAVLPGKRAHRAGDFPIGSSASPAALTFTTTSFRRFTSRPWKINCAPADSRPGPGLPPLRST